MLRRVQYILEFFLIATCEYSAFEVVRSASFPIAGLRALYQVHSQAWVRTDTVKAKEVRKPQICEAH